MTTEARVEAYLRTRHGAGVALAREMLRTGDDEGFPRLERVLASTPDGTTVSYVVKRLRRRAGWVGRVSHDDRLREYQLVQGGIVRAFPKGVASAVLDAMTDDDGATLILRDVEEAMALTGVLLPGQSVALLQGLAAFHSTFYGFPARLMGGLGLCPLAAWLTLFSPAVARRERENAEGRMGVADEILSGWDRVSERDPATWRELASLLDDPQPVVRALRECPDTFVHGNLDRSHIAFDDTSLTLLGWSQVTRGPGALDLAHLLATSQEWLSLTEAEAIEVYREERERRGRLPAAGERWERELAIARFAAFMRTGWQGAGYSKDDVATLITIARRWM